LHFDSTEADTDTDSDPHTYTAADVHEGVAIVDVCDTASCNVDTDDAEDVRISRRCD
jgi:hypothetical protein